VLTRTYNAVRFTCFIIGTPVYPVKSMLRIRYFRALQTRHFQGVLRLDFRGVFCMGYRMLASTTPRLARARAYTFGKVRTRKIYAITSSAPASRIWGPSSNGTELPRTRLAVFGTTKKPAAPVGGQGSPKTCAAAVSARKLTGLLRCRSSQPCATFRPKQLD
jgi:hypothetical protein